MPFVREGDRPGDVVALIVVIIIALIVLFGLPHPVWVWIG